MARTSNRYLKNQDVKVESIYKAGIYTRLSNERREYWRSLSNSIETQIFCCKEYANNENISVSKIYTDYEYSGTNFERPSYKEMIQDIKNGNINCIIIKDLSRLGREYLEMGILIDKVFPFLGVRFISIDDKLDTDKEVDVNKSFEVILKNIINDMYAKDISIKIKTSKELRARNGYFIGTVPPYGYKVTKSREGQKLTIDDNVKFIIDEIFRLALQGNSPYFIARKLNTKEYSNPTLYYKTGKIYREDLNFQWIKSSINKILRNPVYMGDLVQGVRQQNLAKGKKQYYADKDDWIVFKNAHEPIITREEYKKIQEGLKYRKHNSSFSNKKIGLVGFSENKYKGLVYGKETNALLHRKFRYIGENKNILDYIFINERYDGKLGYIPKIFIRENTLDDIIKDSLKNIILKITSKQIFVQKIKSTVGYKKDIITKKLIKLNDKLEHEKYSLRKIYEEYRLYKITRDEYFERKKYITYKISNIENEITFNIDTKKDIIKYEKELLIFIKNIFALNEDFELNKDLISLLIDKIVVSENKTINVIFRFNLDKIQEEFANE